MSVKWGYITATTHCLATNHFAICPKGSQRSDKSEKPAINTLRTERCVTTSTRVIIAGLLKTNSHHWRTDASSSFYKLTFLLYIALLPVTALGCHGCRQSLHILLVEVFFFFAILFINDNNFNIAPC